MPPETDISRRGLLGSLGWIFGLRIVSHAQAATNPELLDMGRFVYVPSAMAPNVTIVNVDNNRITGSLPIGVVAQQVAVSRGAAALVAADGKAASLSLVDVFNGTIRKVTLSAPVGRLTVSADENSVAAIEPHGSTISVVDLGEGKMKTRVAGLPLLRDVMFGEQDTVLYFAAEGINGIGVIDIASGRLSRIIAGIGTGSAGFAALARTTDGRQLLAQPAENGPINVMDPGDQRPPAQLAVGPGVAGMFPSPIGNYLMIPNDQGLAVFRSGELARPVVLPGAAEVTGVYATWLDSIAFMPSEARRSVFTYDLDHMQPLPEIPLPGKPVRGAVTADTRTFYLPISDPPQLLAIDGATHRVAKVIELPSQPLTAVIAGGSGLCH